MSRTLGPGNYLWTNSAIVSGYPFTLACKFRPSSVASFQSLIGIWNPGLDSTGHWVGFDGDIVRAVSCADGITTAYAYANRTELANAEVTVVGRFINATTREVVVNADFANKGLDNVTNIPFGTPSVCYFGADGGGNTPALGDGGQVAIWNEAIPDWAVTAFYLGYSPMKLRFDKLLRYWPVGLASPDPELRGNTALTVNGSPDPKAPARMMRPTRAKLSIPLPAAALGQPAALRRMFPSYSAEGMY